MRTSVASDCSEISTFFRFFDFSILFGILKGVSWFNKIGNSMLSIMLACARCKKTRKMYTLIIPRHVHFPPLRNLRKENNWLGRYHTTILSWATRIQPHMYFEQKNEYTRFYEMTHYAEFRNLWRDPTPKNELFNLTRPTLSIIICGSFCMASTVF